MTTKKENYLIPILKQQKREIENLMPAFVEDRAKFFNNTVTAIKRDPNLIKYCFEKKSCYNLVIEIEKLARLGLTIGGQRPQAYIVPFKGQPAAIATADGFKFVVTAGKNAIFKSIKLYKIFKGEKFKLDEANGIFEKKQTSAEEFETETTENFVGFVFVGITVDNEKIVQKVTRIEIEHHRTFSKQANGSMWKDHYMRMAEKTAIKHVLRDYIYVCEGLANLDEFEGLQQKEKTIEEKASEIDASAFETAAEVPSESPEVQQKKDDQSVADIL